MNTNTDTLLEEARKELNNPEVWKTLTDAEQACVHSDTAHSAIVTIRLAAIQVRTLRFELGLGKELPTHTPAEIMLRTMLGDREFMFWNEHDKRKANLFNKKGGR
jgi:predicted negative regulator of RcsB-dependent stress response